MDWRLFLRVIAIFSPNPLMQTYCALGVVEWFITSVDSLMCLQIIYGCTFVVTLGAAEWFFTSMHSQMPSLVTILCEFLLTWWTDE